MNSIVGRPYARVDGPAKVTGHATYAADQRVEGLAYGALVQSTIARGRITRFDSRAAEAAPGVLAVFTTRNFPRFAGTPTIWPFGKSHYPLQDDVIYYDGQPVAYVVAETLEQARHAADLVRVDYDDEQPDVELSTRLDTAFVPEPAHHDVEMTAFTRRLHGARRKLLGNPAAARGELVVDTTYHTPMQHHNPMEPAATIAVWDGDQLTLYDATQSIAFTQTVVATVLGIPEQNVRVVAPFLGGGFGCKGWVWPHTFATAAVAREVHRPVKLVLTRAQSYTSHGHRAETAQDLTVTADRSGRLTAITHIHTAQISAYDDLIFGGTDVSTTLYACPNVEVEQRGVRLDIDTPAAQRPPEGPPIFALESAMDELSYAAGVDPLELRLRNYAETDPDTGEPYGSGKFLDECYRLGAKRFGWKRRRHAPRSMRKGDSLVGQGMATAFHGSYLFRAKARVRLTPDGRALVRSGTQDIGTGTYTVITQVAADALGMSMGSVRFELGDTTMPLAPTSSGSTTAMSVSNAVHAAGITARDQVILVAITDPESPLYGSAPDAIVVEKDRLYLRNNPRIGETYRDVLGRHGQAVHADGESTADGVLAGHGYGAVFAEVRVDAYTGEVRVTRMVGAFDVGRVLNHNTARSQAIGGMIWGIGFALTEHTLMDANIGRIVTPNLAGYLVPVQADVPYLDVQFVDRPDPKASTLGARGMGEVVSAGVPAAIANAVHHATGRRVRDLPITPDKLL